MKLSVYQVLKEMNSAEDAKKSGKMVALYVPIEISSLLNKKFKNVPGDEVQPKDMHITLGLVHEEDDRNIIELIKCVAELMNPFPIRIDSFDFFEPNEHNDKKYVLHAKPKSSQLTYLHDLIMMAAQKLELKIDNGSFKFNPHITIKYCTEKPNISNEISTSFDVNDIVFAKGDFVKRVKFSGQ